MEFDNISHTYTNPSRTWEIVLGTVHINFFPYEQTSLMAYPETKKKKTKTTNRPWKISNRSWKKNFSHFQSKKSFHFGHWYDCEFLRIHLAFSHVNIVSRAIKSSSNVVFISWSEANETQCKHLAHNRSLSKRWQHNNKDGRQRVCVREIQRNVNPDNENRASCTVLKINITLLMNHLDSFGVYSARAILHYFSTKMIVFLFQHIHSYALFPSHSIALHGLNSFALFSFSKWRCVKLLSAHEKKEVESTSRAHTYYIYSINRVKRYKLIYVHKRAI